MRLGIIGLVPFAACLAACGIEVSYTPRPQGRLCTGNPGVEWSQQIEACTALIQSGKETGHNQAGYFNNRGNAYKAQKDLDRAMADYNEAIRLDPKLAVAFSDRGLAFQAQGDHQRAMADFNQAIELDPKLALAYNNRGFEYQIKGDLERALADYDEAIRLDPKLAPAYKNLENTYKAIQGN